MKPTTTRTALRLLMIGAAAASITACASRPKPAGPAQTTTTAPPPAASTETPPSAGVVGESVIPGSERDFVINAGDRVYFDFDSYTIRADAQPILDSQAAWLKRYPGVRVRIEGNTDERGTREYNLALGARRANSVRDHLIGAGVTSDRIATVSYGKEKPVDAGTGEEAWARNRNARTGIISGAR